MRKRLSAILAITLVSAIISAAGCSSSKSSTDDTDGGTVNGYNINLKSLDITGGTLSPAFKQTVTGYTVEVAGSTASVNVTPAVVDPQMTITVNGVTVSSGSESASIPVTSGSPGAVIITVTAPDNTTKKSYIIAVTRAALTGTNCLLSNITLSAGVLSDTFNPNVENLRAEVASGTDSISVTSKAAGTGTSILVNNTAVADNSQSQDIPLVTGKNWITVDVTAADGVSKKHYKIECVKLPEKSKNGFLSNIYLSAGIVSPVFNRTTYNYTAEVSQSVSSITLTPVAAGINETVVVNGTVVESGTASAGISLVMGANTITVTTVSEDGTTRIAYRVVVTRLSALSSNTDLSGLTTSGGRLNPAFDPAVRIYTLYISSPGLTVTPYGKSAGQTITVNGVVTAHGTSSAQLPVGDSVIVKVMAENGTFKSYLIDVKPDTTPPAAGTISSRVVESRFITLNWSAAIDNLSAQSDISYAVYQSTGADISTVANAEKNGVCIKQYSKNILECAAVKLSLDTEYLFTVIAQDEAGNRSAYPVFTCMTRGASRSVSFNGSVDTMLAYGSNLYLGGSFTYVGISAPYSACFDLSDSQPLFIPETNGSVLASVPDGEGGWYIGGNFKHIMGISRNGIAHILADGTIDDWNPNASNTVRAITISGSTLYAGGSFTSIGAQTRNCIAAIDLTTGNATSWNPNANSSISTIAISGSTLFAGGNFTTIGGQTRNKIAAIDLATGNATSWNPNSNSDIYTIAISGSILYAGGGFTTIGSQTRNCIAAIDLATGNATSWNPNANSSISILAISGSTLYVGGSFTNIGGQTRNNLAAIDIASGNITSWDPGVSGSLSQIVSIAISGSTLYAGGSFTSIGGQTRNNIAAIDLATGTVTSWNPNVGEYVFTIAINGSTLFVGGGFTSIGGQTRNNLAAIDLATGNVTAWNPNANGSVLSLAINGSTLYAGGDFTGIGGQTRNCIAAVDLSTANGTSWNPNANGRISTIAINGSTLYTGGEFTTIGGQSRNRIAAIDLTTGNATSWNPNANSSVSTMVINGSTLYAGGRFSNIGGQTRNRIAAIDLLTGNATSWNPNANSDIITIAISGSTLFAGGNFTGIGGQPRNYIAAIDLLTGNATSWNPNLGFSFDFPYFYNVFIIVINGSTLYAGGNFSSVGDQQRNYIAAFDITTGNVTSWNPNLSMAGSGNGSVYAITISGSTVYSGGTFITIGNYCRPNFAAIDAVTGLPEY